MDMHINRKRKYLERVKGESKKGNNKNKKEDKTVETRKEGMAQQGKREKRYLRKMLRQMNKGKISREEYAEEKGKIIKFGAKKKEKDTKRKRR